MLLGPTVKRDFVDVVCSASMDFDGQPSRFVEYDTETSRVSSLSRAISFPSWHGCRSFDDDMIGSDDDIFRGTIEMSEPKTQFGSNRTGRYLLMRIRNSKLAPCKTWSSVLTASTDLQSDKRSVVEQQQPSAQDKDHSCVATFIVGEQPVDTRDVTSSYSSASSTEDQLDPRDLPLDQTDHSLGLMLITSTIEPFVQLLNVRQDLQQQQQRAAGNQRPKLFGLPGRINVSLREVNMMSPSSFWITHIYVVCQCQLHFCQSRFHDRLKCLHLIGRRSGWWVVAICSIFVVANILDVFLCSIFGGRLLIPNLDVGYGMANIHHGKYSPQFATWLECYSVCLLFVVTRSIFLKILSASGGQFWV